MAVGQTRYSCLTSFGSKAVNITNSALFENHSTLITTAMLRLVVDVLCRRTVINHKYGHAILWVNFEMRAKFDTKRQDRPKEKTKKSKTF
jgi:hypothetical protein